jgi:hypothetical protein
VKLLRAISKAIGRLNRWIGPTVAAESLNHGGGGLGGTHVDPIGVDLLNSELAQARAEDTSD